MHTADGVLEIDAVMALAAWERTLGRTDDSHIARSKRQYHWARLHARTLLGHHEFATREFLPGLGQQRDNLQGENVLAFLAVMQAYVVPFAQPVQVAQRRRLACFQVEP